MDDAKQPGSETLIKPIAMDFCQSCEVGLNTPEAYELLLHDAARGDSTYFTRWDEVAAAWKFVDLIANVWAQDTDGLEPYEANSWGPAAAHELLEQDGFKWWPVNGQAESEVVWVNSK